MPWFKIDDGFHGHPKVAELSPEDVGVWTLAGTWCAQYLTDGRITLRSVQRLGGAESNCQALVEANLWLEIDGAYQFKDWDDYQPVKADVEAEREAARERMRELRAKKKGVQEHSSSTSGEVQANKVSTSGEVRSTPTLPFPSRPVPKSDSGKPNARGNDTPEHRATNEAYEKTGKALNFMATRGIAKWAIHERGKSEAQVSEAIVSTYKAGKPVTKQTIGQYLDGITQGSPQPTGKPTVPNAYRMFNT